MKKTLVSLTTIAALTFAVGIGIATDARAEIRIAATVHTPNVSVRAGYGNPSGYYDVRPYRRLPSRRYMGYELGRRDRMIARRMTWYTGVRIGELMRLRRHGYNWFEIGRWLHMPRPVVRAAMHQKSWDRFLRAERRHAKRHGRHRDRVTYYDGREYRRR